MKMEKEQITDMERDVLKSWLWADHLLYDHFFNLLEKKVNTFGIKRMKASVEMLTQKENELFQKCLMSKNLLLDYWLR